MKKLIAAIGLTVLSLNAGAKDWADVRLASEGAYPPFNELAPDGSLKGLDIDVGNAICAEMKLKCTWVKHDWDGMIPALLARKFDAILASMSITDERKQKVDFSNKYYASPLVLIGKAGLSIKPDATSLKGKKVAVQRGVTADNFAIKYWVKHGVTVTRYAKQEEAYADLIAGSADLVLVDYWEARGGFLNTPAGRSYSVVGDKIYGRTSDERATIGEGIGIAIRKQDKELREIFNKGIAVIRANGTYEKITRKYFTENIYGN